MRKHFILMGAWLAFGLIQPAALSGQSHEISVLAGATVHSASVDIHSSVQVAAGVSATVQVDYAYLLRQSETGRLCLELPVARVLKVTADIQADRLTAGQSQLFLTPGIRYEFGSGSRIRPYLAAGFGLGSFDGASIVVSPALNVHVTDGIKPAAGFGAGVEFRIGRNFGFRTEIRDYLALGGDISARNHMVFQGGFGVHF